MPDQPPLSALPIALPASQPRPTFEKLPPEKRARFIAVALEEFATYPYDQASLTRIVATLGIAKGSVYQYFDGKSGLFAWLVAEAGRQKLAALGDAPPLPAGADLYAQLRGMYLQGLLFVARAPLWARVSLRVLEPSQDPAIAALRAQYAAASQAFLHDLLRQGQEAGMVRADLRLELLTPLVYGLLSDGLLRAFLQRAGAEDPLDPAVTRLSRLDALAAIDTALGLLRAGIGT